MEEIKLLLGSRFSDFEIAKALHRHGNLVHEAVNDLLDSCLKTRPNDEDVGGVIDLLDSDDEFDDDANKKCRFSSVWPKLLGTRHVEAESTFRGKTPFELQSGSELIIVRNTSLQSKQPSILRLQTPCGIEIGRLPRALAEILSPLLDAHNIMCTAHLDYIPEELKLFTIFNVSLALFIPNEGAFQCFSNEINHPENNSIVAESLWKYVQIGLGTISVEGMFPLNESPDSSRETLDDAATLEIEVNEDDDNDENGEEHQRLRVQLRPHQRQAVQWMKQREDVLVPPSKLHFLWKKLMFADGSEFYMNEYSRVVSFTPPVDNKPCRGGILADEMGLGKTIMVLDRIVQDVVKENDKETGTLIVVVTSLLAQWEAEIKSKTRGVSFSVFHGSDRNFSSQTEIVLTTFGVVSSEHSREGSKSPLFSKVWRRIVLDEAQSVRNGDTNQNKAVLDLKGPRRWALTGTPVSNGIEDIYQLLKFIQLEPWCNPQWWNRVIFKPFQTNPGETLKRIKMMLSEGPVMLRRTHQSVGKSSDLPPLSIRLVQISLSPLEREFYDSLYELSKLEFKRSSSASYLSVLALLTKLRQAVDHPRLVQDQHSSQMVFPASSSKLDRLREEIEAILLQDSSTKIVVFSQFLGMLDLLQSVFPRSLRLDGSMSSTKRAEALKNFRENAHVPLLFMSLKAGCLGLNLTCANVVILLDPWWSPSVEAQAIGRCHRIGQVKPVLVLRFIATSTVEEKMLLIQEKKRKMASDMLGFDQFDEESEELPPNGQSNKLTFEDLKDFFT